MLTPFRRDGLKWRGRETPVACSKSQQQGGALLRFMSKRRLLIVSTSSEDDYSFQQQLQGLRGQACPMGKNQTEKERLSWVVVNGLRDQLKLNREYFSVVGKDGDMNVWFPSPCGLWPTSMTWWPPWSCGSKRRSCRGLWVFTVLRILAEFTKIVMMKQTSATFTTGQRSEE
nr:coiled-coil domain-containing protein 80-like [Salvelinus alpinus]